jgi:hypothetical protein
MHGTSAMNPAFTPAQTRVNDVLTRLLTAAGCRGGRLQFRPIDGAGLVSLSGHHHSGKDIAIFPIELPLKRALGHYAAEVPGGLGFLTIAVDLGPPAFAYHHTSPGAQTQADTQAEAAETTARATRQLEHRERLRHTLSPAPFGPTLAARVAGALAQGRPFNYSHRDYCGAGFDHQGGTFRYGDAWDGHLLDPAQPFADQAGFVAWLARQSDLALARLNEKDAFYWNNQPITRARLEEFVR